MRTHLKSHLHQEKIKEVAKNDLSVTKRGQRNREMGRRLGTLAYFLYYNILPFILNESFLPWFTLNNIDMRD